MDSFLWKFFNLRLNLMTFIAGHLLIIAVWLAIMYAYPVLDNVIRATEITTLIFILSLLFLLVFTLLFLYALQVRGWHDISGERWLGRAWWASGMFLAPYLGSKGETEKNKYGKPPKPGIDLKGLFGF